MCESQKRGVKTLSNQRGLFWLRFQFLQNGTAVSLANTTKKLGAVSVLQSKVNALAAKQNPTVIAPLIQQATANCFKTLCFHGNDAYDLSSGMLPASVVPSKVYSSLGTQLIKDVEAINANVSMWNAAGSTVTTDDLKLIHKVKHFVPTKFEEALLQIQGFLMLLGVAMGEPILCTWVLSLPMIGLLKTEWTSSG